MKVPVLEFNYNQAASNSKSFGKTGLLSAN